MNVLLLEDDHLQAFGIAKLLKAEEDLKVQRLDVLSTESEFQSEFEKIASARPPYDIIIVDVMMRWANPAPDMPEPPEDVRKGGFFRAGIRCQKRLAEDDRTKRIPVLVYTVLNSSRLPEDVQAIQKSSDPTELVREIKRLTAEFR